MKKNVIIAIVSPIILAVAFLAFAPKDRISYVKKQILRAANDPAQKCFDYHEHELRDPASGIIVGSEKTNNKIVIEIKAMNVFGAYVSDSFACGLKNGRFNMLETLAIKYTEK